MEHLVLGRKPEKLTVILVQGSDFICRLVSSSPWPVGAIIELVFDDPQTTRWRAAVNGTVADWNVDKSLVEQLIASYSGRPSRVATLLYNEGAADILWARGLVTLDGW